MNRGQVFYYTSIILTLILTSILQFTGLKLPEYVAYPLLLIVTGSFFIRIFSIEPKGKILEWFGKEAKWVNKKLERFS